MDNLIFSNIKELINKGKLPHAILIDSGKASDRDELASYIASYYVCDESGPCGKCKSCQKALNESHPDIIIYDPEANNEKMFKVGAIRDIRSDVHIMPNEAKHKVYILKNVDKMNIQAQNAFLKTLEEPPSYARFILLCESRSPLLETILSRVTSFSLLKEDNQPANDYDIKADNLANELATALAQVTELSFMQLSSAFEKDKDLISPVVSALQLIFRDAVAVSTGSNLTLSRHGDTAKLLASKLPLKTLITLVENTDHFIYCLNINANKNLLITRFCSVLRNTAYGA